MMTKEQIDKLLIFYGVDSLESLVEAQARHVERLQEKVPPLRDEQARNPRFA